MRALAIAAVVVAAAAAPARAHTMSDGHLIMAAGRDTLDGALDLPVRDLHDVLGLDADGDGAITWREIEARRDAIVGYVVDRLAIRSADGACPLTAGALGALDRADGAHVAIALVARCPGPTTAVSVDYRLLHELDAQHRGLIRIGDGSGLAIHRAGPVALTVRSGVLARAAAAIPGGTRVFYLAAALIAIGLVTLLRRRRR
jgi:hypothetical protein